MTSSGSSKYFVPGEGTMYCHVTLSECLFFQDCKMVCRQNKACVQCLIHHTGEFKDSCEENCRDRNIIKKPSLPGIYYFPTFIHVHVCMYRSNHCVSNQG